MKKFKKGGEKQKRQEIQVLRKNIFFKKAYVPLQLLPNNIKDVYTLEMDVVLVTRNDVSNYAVRSILDAVFSDVDAVYAIHPAIDATHFSGNDFFKRATGAPLHDAAKSFYKERMITELTPI